MQRMYKTALGLSLILLMAACAPNSDAVSILGTQNTSLQATVTAFQSYGPTMTANALMATRVQSTLAAVMVQNKELTQKLNAQAPQPTIPIAARSAVMDSATPGPGNASGIQPTPAGASGAAVTAPNGFSFADVATSKAIDSASCAVNKAASFAAADPKIYVVADVRNLKKGTAFTAKWSGPDFEREDSWTANANRPQLCIYFYIEPKTLGLQGGDYSVTLSAAGLNGNPISFSIQQTQQQQDQQGQQGNTNAAQQGASDPNSMDSASPAAPK
ncbi:MAG: hypothetical protein IT324_21350 [Anaerolineae bacterium]|nr:hypothetical protein [Anaerolineae bacterium]